jgi:hypothetical protein
MQPRIYTYKITFEEVPYYYYGSKKEKKFDEEYWGSPVTNKWCWELYTPKKQILEIFDYTDEGYNEAHKVEGRLIKPVFNTDKWCLNANCGGKISLDIVRKNGKKAGVIAGKKTYENKTGLFSLNEEERKNASSKGGKIGSQKNKENKVGIFALTPEQLSENGKIGGKIGGKKAKELGLGVHGKSKEERRQYASKAGKVGANIKWMCTETGYVSNCGGLSSYQKKRGIETSKRIRLEPTDS